LSQVSKVYICVAAGMKMSVDVEYPSDSTVQTYTSLDEKVDLLLERMSECLRLVKQYMQSRTADQNRGDRVVFGFKEVQVLCEKNSLQFKNQTFIQVVKQLRTKYFDELNGRIHFSKDFKQLVLDKTQNKCAKCECCLKGKKYDIDHVRPLSNGGTNYKYYVKHVTRTKQQMNKKTGNL
jgi:hypothetical protein